MPILRGGRPKRSIAAHTRTASCIATSSPRTSSWVTLDDGHVLTPSSSISASPSLLGAPDDAANAHAKTAHGNAHRHALLHVAGAVSGHRRRSPHRHLRLRRDGASNALRAHALRWTELDGHHDEARGHARRPSLSVGPLPIFPACSTRPSSTCSTKNADARPQTVSAAIDALENGRGCRPGSRLAPSSMRAIGVGFSLGDHATRGCRATAPAIRRSLPAPA